MKRITYLVGALVLGVVVGCTVPDDRAKHVLEGAGYTKVNLGDRAWWGCSEDDNLTREFAAIGPSGRHVTGSVCCGAFAKNCTVRLD